MSETPTQQIAPAPIGEKACGKCYHWTVFQHLGIAPLSGITDETIGRCRRFPPVLDGNYNAHSTRGAVSWIWPLCRADSVCGEWRARDGGTPPATQYAFDQGAFA